MTSSSDPYARAPDERVWWAKSAPFFLMHLMPLGLLWTGVRLVDLVLCAALYGARMFFISAGYHRYFSHRAFKTSRIFQFVLGFGGATAVQKGALWWAGHHRGHHKYSDGPLDVHSPKRGFWWSHMGWITCKKYDATPTEQIRDFAKYPELRWLNRFHIVPPILLAVACFALGGPSALFAGFFLSTVLLYHGTFVVNSLAHLWGTRRYKTTGTSRNNGWLALVTFGECWHNNHHYYQSSANQGFFWWEIDLSYYLLRALSWIGIVWDIRTPPKKLLRSNLENAAGHESQARRVESPQATLLAGEPVVLQTKLKGTHADTEYLGGARGRI